MHSANYIDFVVIPHAQITECGDDNGPTTYTRTAQMFFREGQIRILFIFRGPENRRMSPK